MKKLLFRLTGFLAFCLICLAVAPQAGAIDVGLRGIKPAHPIGTTGPGASWFIYELDRGETKEDAVLVTNQSDEDYTVEIYAVDAETTSDGAFAPLKRYYEHKDVGAWITLPQSVVTVPAKSEVEIPFTVKVPDDDVDVGEHFGAIIIQELKEKDTLGSGTGVEIVTRVGVRMYVTIPGEIKKGLEITDFRYELISRLNHQKEIVPVDRFLDFLGLKPSVRYFLQMRNTGNVRVEPYVTLKIKNIFGRTIYESEEKYLGIVMPGRTNEVPLDWIDPPFIGKFTTTIELRFEGGETLTTTETVWIIPYPLIILIAAIIVLIIIIRLLFMLIVAKEKSKMKVHIVREGETIESIAGIYHVSWKYLARVNKLKAPYQLNVGQEILIPKENLWLSFIKSFFSNKKNVIILAAVLVLIGGAIGYYYWQKHREEIKLMEEAAEADRQRQQDLEVVLGERIEADAQRKEDLKTIQSALIRYFGDEGRYPLAEGRSKTTDEVNIFQTDLVAKGYLDKLLVDPKHPNYYYGYQTDAEGRTYELTCVLENKTDDEGIRINDFVFYRLRSDDSQTADQNNSNE